MITSLPNLLTLARVAAVPAIVALLYWPDATGSWLACGLFAAAAITDFFDGYLARAMAQQSAFGRFLDPIADKLLVAAVLLMLAGTGRIDGLALIAAAVILCREILVSGLREFLAGLSVTVPVSELAKWKTTIQMVAIGILIVGDAGPADIPVRTIGEAGLWVAAILTIVTGYDYLRAGLGHMGIGARPEPSYDDGEGDEPAERRLPSRR
ncbi:MAG: CDP-diacylglycerol--glycerol-3-phosphate 3-phosphatidyltransferase [Rhodospirillales bacterium]